jgi:Aldo/keto reductase family
MVDNSSVATFMNDTPTNALFIPRRPENLRRSVDTINKHLRGLKKLDLFESARVDPKVPIEDTIAVLAQLIKEGKFDYIGISEASAATLKRANAVSYPFDSGCLLLKVSRCIQSRRLRQRSAPGLMKKKRRKASRLVLGAIYLVYLPCTVISTAKELGVAVVAYS